MKTRNYAVSKHSNTKIWRTAPYVTSRPQEILKVIFLVIRECWFQLDTKFYEQMHGLAMPVTASALAAEILQCVEDNIL
jgi:hypothetical protein